MKGQNRRSFPPQTCLAGAVLSRGISQRLRLETLADGKATGRMYHGMYNSDPQNRPFTLSHCPKATDHVSVFTKNRACCGWLLRCAGTGRAEKNCPGTTTPLPAPHPAATHTRYGSEISGKNWKAVK